VIITPLLMMQALQIGSKFASEVVEDPKLKNNLSMLSKGLGVGAQLGEAFKPPSIGDVTEKDPLSFNEALTINKDGKLFGIDYEKFNFDKGMKPFSTGIKNSGSIFSFNEGLKINKDGGISGIDYGKNNFDKFPNYFN